MRNESWLAALDHELTTHRIGPVERAELLVEAESFLAEAEASPQTGSALHHFGPPADYARSLAQAMGVEPSGPGSGSRGRGDGPAVLVGEGLTKSYRGALVLDEVSLSVRAGEIVALVGPNGAGKTTLLRILAGLVSPDRGQVTRSATLGYAPQEGGLDPYLRPLEHVELFGVARGLSRAEARRQGDRLGRELGWNLVDAPLAAQLSGGTRRKLSVVSAMVGEPDVLLLDEPYQGMDAASSARFWELLWCWGTERGRAAVVSTHDRDVLGRASAVVELTGATR